ncbi:CALCINEURIN B-LIKE PROTEIN [Salix viminalis]|uniref:Calcineurin B-like protein n=1 Tax=Salix viminalis TaxID=40686 RepID=A0A9Q0QDG5_SALVM|nr:CALCINEURIN B-LIKE PROTEIN [Salix viminalis]
MDSSSSSLAISERVCAVFIPLIGIIQSVVLSFTACFDHHLPPKKLQYTIDDLRKIASKTLFTVNEVEALLDLFKKLSSSIIDDGLIHKEELKLALLKTPASDNLILDRLFALFDEKKNGAIEFEEFVHVLNVFHPRAPLEAKIDFAFRLYDLRQTGFIEREEVRQMLNAILMESELQISAESLELIIDKTFADADADRDGRINKLEWKAFATQHPNLLKNMTLPYLRDITTMFPSFIFNTEVED